MTRIIVCIISLLGISGCLPKNIIDDVQLIQGMVIDAEKGQQIKLTVVSPSIKKKHGIEVWEGIGHTVKSARQKIAKESPLPLVSGQLRVALFTKQLAQRGGRGVLGTLLRDSMVSHQIYLAILVGSGKSLFSKKYEGNQNAAIYINKMLKHNMETGILPSGNLHLTDLRYYQEGQSTFMPILKEKTNTIQIQGLALFRGKTYVGELNSKEMQIFKCLYESFQLATLTYKVADDYVVLKSMYSKPVYRVAQYKGKTELQIQIQVQGSIQEVSKSICLDKNKSYTNIQHAIEKQITKESYALLKKLQSLHVDPLGLGVKLKQNSLTVHTADEAYTKLPMCIKTQVTILNSGILQ